MSNGKGSSRFDKIMTRSAGANSLSLGEKAIEGAIMLPINKIIPNIFQVRQNFDPESLVELAADIKERGILEPLIVRESELGQYEIIAGERRFRAAQQIELTEVPVIVRKMNDKEARFATLAENLQRQNLDPRDEQRFFQQLQAEYNLSLRDIARLINKSPQYVQRRLDGELVTLQQPIENGDKSNNNSAPVQKLKNSQYEKQPSSKPSYPLYNPAVYKRVAQFFDSALEVMKGEPEPAIRQQIQEQIEDAEKKIAELKKQLTKGSKE